MLSHERLTVRPLLRIPKSPGERQLRTPKLPTCDLLRTRGTTSKTSWRSRATTPMRENTPTRFRAQPHPLRSQRTALKYARTRRNELRIYKNFYIRHAPPLMMPPFGDIRRCVSLLHRVILSLDHCTEIMHYPGTPDGQTPRRYITCNACKNLRKLVEGYKKQSPILKTRLNANIRLMRPRLSELCVIPK